MTITTLDLGNALRPLKIIVDLDPQSPNEQIALNFIRAGTYYEPDVAHAMMRIIAPGDVTVDVGANIGLFSLLMAGLSAPGGRVLAFEPGDNNLPKLRRNIELSAFANIEVIQKPVSDAPADITFYINNDDGGGNALWNPREFPTSRNEPRLVTMRTTTLDAEIAARGLPVPKVIKIDTEGAELNVLRGARELLTDRKVPFIVAEYHEFGLQQMKTSPQELRQFMASFGYDMFVLNGNGALPKLIPLGTVLRTQYIPNVLFSTPALVAQAWPEDWFEPSYTAPNHS